MRCPATSLERMRGPALLPAILGANGVRLAALLLVLATIGGSGIPGPPPGTAPPSVTAPDVVAHSGSTISAVPEAVGAFASSGWWGAETGFRPLAPSPNPGAALFAARSHAVDVLFAPSEVHFVPPGGTPLTLRFPGSSPTAPEGVQPTGPRFSSFVGWDPRRWLQGEPSFESIRFSHLYPGIDLSYTLVDGSLKYHFDLAAGADERQIALAYGGADGLEVRPDGSLAIRAGALELTDSRPVVSAPQDVEPTCRFAVDVPQSASFRCTGVDRSRPWTIDPLVYGTYFGGNARDHSSSVAVDTAGNAYFTGWTNSSDFPVTLGGVDTGRSGRSDAYAAKFNVSTGGYDYVVMFGGNQADVGYSIAVNDDGEAYITGPTGSPDFPTTPGAFDRNGSNHAAFLLKLNANGSALIFSTFVGDPRVANGHGLALGLDGAAYITGGATDGEVPVTPGAFDTTYNRGNDAFVIKVNASGAAVDYATYLGSTSFERGQAIVVDDAGAAFVAGGVQGGSFPTTPGTLKESTNGSDGFVTKLSPDGSALVFSTLVGDGNSGLASIELEPNGDLLIVGGGLSPFPAGGGCAGDSSGDFPWFLARLSANGTTAYDCLSLSASGSFGAEAFRLPDGRVIAGGQTNAFDLPVTPGAVRAEIAGPWDPFVLVANLTAGTIDYLSYLGGSGAEYGVHAALGPNGVLTLVGYTESNDLPLSVNAADLALSGERDVFLMRIDFSAFEVLVDTRPSGLTVDVGSLRVSAPYRLWCTAGTTINLSADATVPGANTRYTFSGWSDGGARQHTVSCNGNATLVANYSTEFLIDVNTSPPGLVVFAGSVNGTAPFSMWCLEGAPLAVRAETPQVGVDRRFVFESWSDGGSAAHDASCLAPGSLNATFSTEWPVSILTDPVAPALSIDGVPTGSELLTWWSDGSVHVVGFDDDLNGSGGQRFRFDRWSDGGARNHTVTAEAPVQLVTHLYREFFVEFATSPPGRPVTVDGSLTGTPAAFWWAEGSDHLLEAGLSFVDNGTRLEFATWSDGGDATHFLTASSPVSITCTYRTSYRVRISTSPPGLPVMVNGEAVQAPIEVWLPDGSALSLGPPPPQGNSSERWVFDQWQDGTGGSREEVVSGPTETLASFRLEYAVSVEAAPAGAEVLVDGETVVARWDFWWVAGSNHSLEAVDSGAGGGLRYGLVEWSDGGAPSHVVQATAPVLLTARYEVLAEIHFAGGFPGPSVVVDNVAVGLPATFWWSLGSVHAVRVVEDGEANGTRWFFEGWVGGGAVNRSIEVTGPANLTLLYARAFAVWVRSDPAGVPVTVDGATAPASGPAWWTEAVPHRVDAPAEFFLNGSLYRFVSWSDAGPAQHNVSAVGPTELVATYERVPPTTPNADPALDGFLATLLLILAAALAVAFVVLRRRRLPPEA